MVQHGRGASHRRRFVLKLDARNLETRLVLVKPIRDREFSDGHSIAPAAHESLFGCVAERVAAVLAVEGRVAQRIGRLPVAVVVQGVDSRRPADRPMCRKR